MNLQPIQGVLLVCFLGALVVYFRFFRSQLLDRLIGVALFALACFLVLVPSSTQWLATQLGVGRGTDLTFYLFVVVAVFFAVLIYSKLNRLSRTITEVVRRLAIVEAAGQARHAGSD